MSHNLLDFSGEVAELALHLMKYIDDLTGTIAKGCCYLFDGLDFIFR